MGKSRRTVAFLVAGLSAAAVLVGAQISRTAEAQSPPPAGTGIGFPAPINVVLGTPGAPKTATYVAPFQQQQGFDIPVSVPKGSKLVAAWYVPVDNLGDLPSFDHIDVAVRDNNVRLTIKGREGKEALVRIYIYTVYARA